MKTITTIWKDMGFISVPNPSLPAVPGDKNTGKTGFGDPNHYTEISKNADNKRNLIR
jgi:hypothetical protein